VGVDLLHEREVVRLYVLVSADPRATGGRLDLFGERVGVRVAGIRRRRSMRSEPWGLVGEVDLLPEVAIRLLLAERCVAAGRLTAETRTLSL
jgi:hypothetical protein